jgi:hypothetical protein
MVNGGVQDGEANELVVEDGAWVEEVAEIDVEGESAAGNELDEEGTSADDGLDEEDEASLDELDEEDGASLENDPVEEEVCGEEENFSRAGFGGFAGQCPCWSTKVMGRGGQARRCL